MMNIFTFGAVQREVAINYLGMQTLDWSIIIGMIILLIGILIYCQRYVRNAADFLAANRCAGRYVLCISQGVASFAVVSSVATWEAFLKSGFASTWWYFISAPVLLILSLFAWVTYRMRETRCFTLAQFYEVRYSRKLRIGSGIITWASGVLNYGIFPAVSVRFFLFFCRLPEYVEFLGIRWNVYGSLLAICIGLGVCFAAFGGQIAIMVTDFVQGVFCNIAFLIFIFFILKLGEWDIFGGFVSWDDIARALNTESGYSHVDPFDCNKYSDFNIWYYLIGLLAAFYSTGAWQGAAGYKAAAKTPHEAKMAGVLATWRVTAQSLMITLFPLAVIAIIRLPEFSDLNRIIQDSLAQTANTTLKGQGLVPTALSMIMPGGLLGLFVAVMFAAMLTTDDTYIHSWGSIFIQDVIMPFKKKPFTPKQHIWVLRASIVFVGIFAWCFSFFYSQNTPVYLFFALTGAIVSGAGAVVIGGLYWKRGGTIAAWSSYIFSAVTGVAGIIIPFHWKESIAPYLAENFRWQWVLDNMDTFPIHGQWITLINMVGCSLLYVIISLLEHYLFKKPDFNMDKMLHRGEYDIKNEHADNGQKVSWLARGLGITPEFTLSDKLIYAASIALTLLWLLVFVWFTLQKFFFGGVPVSQWMLLWHIKIYFTLILGVICTIWFLIGGIVDVIGLFRALKATVINNADDGSVVDGSNAGE